MSDDIDVLLCYRGRYGRQVQRLDQLLHSHHLRVTYDAEILAGGGNYTEAEIEWRSLGLGENDTRTAWRAPLSAAVKRSALVVFLIDPRDPSENVFNEINWAARAGRPLFIVFDTRGDGHSEEWEAINVGMLQAMYGLAAGRPEAPQFGYHFVTHEEDDGLDQRLTILVNRIVSYYGDTSRDAVGTVRLDHDLTVSDVENTPLARARRRLHELQERIFTLAGVQSPPSRGDPLQQTLARLYEREREGEVRAGRILPRNSAFSYPEHSERERYRRTERLVNEIRPGPFETPELLAMLAREFVSIEMVLASPLRRTILIGTVPACWSNAPVDVVLERDFAVLLVDAGHVDFIYQILKATVLSWKITSPPGRLPVSMSTRPEDTRQTITSNPLLTSGFARSLERMLRQGLPGSSTAGPPPAAYHPALSMLGVFQKRFSLAVALARIAIVEARHAPRAPDQGEPTPLTPSEMIIGADLLAAHLVFASAKALDGAAPTIALQGILIAFAAQALIERAFAGFVPPETVPAAARAQLVAASLVSFLVELGMTEEEAEQHRLGSEQVAATPDMLWQAALAAGDLDLAALQPAPRWRKHIRPPLDAQ